MSDIVDRLRQWNRSAPSDITPHMLMCKAAGEIERLRDDLEKTSALLKESYEITASQSQEIERLRAAVHLGVEMRTRQKTYFKTRDRGDLIASKQAEAAFEKAALGDKP